MLRSLLRRAPVALCLMVVPVPAAAQAAVRLASPGGGVTVNLAVGGGERALRYAVSQDGQPVLAPSPFGLEFRGAPAFGAGVAIREVRRRSGDEPWRRLWGKRTEVANRYNEVSFTLQETAGARRQVEVVFRAYDDGVAFRYNLPQAWGRFELAAEGTGFHFAGEPTVWAATYGGFRTSQEGEFVRRPLGELRADSVYGLPMLVRLAADRWAAVTEADLTDWAGMWLTRGAGAGALATRLAPHPGQPEVAVRGQAPRSSPWRLLMLGRTAGALVESDLVQNLNPPPAGDFSWVRPGLSSWDWWNGPWAPEVDFPVGKNTATAKHFIDLAAEMGWAYTLIDEGWYGPAFAPGATQNGTFAKHPTSRITGVVPELDMPEVLRYAREKGVRVVLWLHWGHVADQMEEAFPLYERWGVAGVKIDFMDRDDQEMVNFYRRVTELAARHRLVVDWHGAYKPTGDSRTFPNLVTREGVMGAEYNKWSARVTPEHNVTLPFTRGLLGELDYTPGGFRNRTPDTFRPVNEAPQVMGTRVHQLAMFVVYESAFGVAADAPYAYRVSPAGADFLKVVPATWDDTRVLHGEPGDFVSIARRSGRDWFVASMTDEQGRTLALPLSFLGAGRWRAEIWADAYEAADFPDRLIRQERVVTAADSLDAVMAPGGGHVVRLTPVP